MVILEEIADQAKKKKEDCMRLHKVLLDVLNIGSTTAQFLVNFCSAV